MSAAVASSRDDAIRRSIRLSGWVGFGWLVGAVYLFLDAAGSTEQSPTAFLVALLLMVLAPIATWSLVHRRFIQVQRQEGPYTAGHAVASLIGCVTLPTILRSLDVWSFLSAGEAWVVFGGGLLVIAVGDAIHSARGGFVRLPTRRPGLASVILVTALLVAATAIAAVADTVHGGLLLGPACAEASWSCAEPGLLGGLFFVFVLGLAVAAVMAWRADITKLGWLIVGVVYFGYMFWIEHIWRLAREGSVVIPDPVALIALHTAPPVLMLGFILYTGHVREDLEIGASPPVQPAAAVE